MKKVLATLVMTTTLVTGCSTIVSSSREEPIREDIGNRTLGNIIEDEAIELKVMVNLSKGSAPLAQSHINVKSFNGQVLLTGQVPNENVRQEAEQIVGQTREVKRIHNELEIAGPSSTIVRSNDIYLTSRVKLKLLSDKSIEGLRVKVVTYLAYSVS